MQTTKKEITLTINGTKKNLLVSPEETLLDALRNAGYFSVKYGCGVGDCGVCTVLVNGKPVKSCQVKAVSMSNFEITTIEGLPVNGKLDPIQEAFVDTGAIQCGFCTPAMILSAKALLDSNPNPTVPEIQKALDPVLCRCTGYVRGVDAVKRAAAVRRKEKVSPFQQLDKVLPENLQMAQIPVEYLRRDANHDPVPPLVFTPDSMSKTKTVGHPEKKVDAKKLALGRPVFTDDFRLPEMLYAELLTSPHAYAKILRINTTKAKALPGVHAVLTHMDVPRIKYATGGQSYPQPKPYDQVVMDDIVRHVGDRVAVVAAETPEIAKAALNLIDVEYEVLPAVVDPEMAMKDGAPIIHTEADTEGIHDPAHNIVHHIEVEVGDVDKGFRDADHIFEGEYRTPKQQHAHLEPHVCITYLDEDDRLVVRTSTQVPFHVRRIIAPLVGVPVKKIRVIKPRIGGGFGNKQEILLEDLCSLLTIKTGHPVRMQFDRRQEFLCSRSRHANIVRYKVGVKGDQVTTASLYLIGDTGAYGTHGLTVNMVGGFKGLTLYNPPNARFICDVVYTNKPPAGAFRGYGAMQCQYGMEVLMEEIAEKLGMDVVQFKKKNWLQIGEDMHLSEKLGEGRPGVKQAMKSSGFEQCVEIGLKATDFYEKRKANRNQTGHIRRGIGMAMVMHGSGIANLDMAAATLKMNDDGSFNLLIGATDLGTGSDTILGQIAAEVLGVPLDDIIVYSSDTDFTPFDKGAYASSTTYVSGGAVRKAALEIKAQLLEQAAVMLELKDKQSLAIGDRCVVATDGRKVTLEEIGLSCLHQQNQHQIMTTASHISPVSPPPTASQFAEIEVNMETGEIKVDRLLMVVDCGRVINPITAAGQVEGGMSQALGFATTEEMLFTKDGQPLNADLNSYKIPHAEDMPIMDVMFVQTDEPTGPFGAKSVSEIAIDGVAPALASALHDATGIWMREVPYTKERVLQSIKNRK